MERTNAIHMPFLQSAVVVCCNCLNVKVKLLFLLCLAGIVNRLFNKALCKKCRFDNV